MLTCSRVDNLADLNERLNTIDDATHSLVRQMDTLTKGFTNSPAGFTPRFSQAMKLLSSMCYLQEDENESKSTSSTDKGCDELGSTAPSRITDDIGHERFFGPFSTYSFFHNARKVVQSLITKNQSLHLPPTSRSPGSIRSPGSHAFTPLHPFVLGELERKYEVVHLEPYREDDLGVPGQTIALPPQMLLDASMQFFFDEPFSGMPIVQKESVFEAIRDLYGPNKRPRDTAWVVLLSNIVLLSAWGKSNGQHDNIVTGSMENGILVSLIDNSKRALHRLEQFSTLRLINVQALLSLVGDLSSFYTLAVFCLFSCLGEDS
jgi:hypothetical protein